MNKLLPLSIGFACLLNSACATVIRGPNVKFHVVTDPPGATVTTDLERKRPKEGESKYHECAPTPCYLHVSRRAEFKTFVQLDGYHPAEIDITSGFGRGGAAAGATGTIVVSAAAYTAIYIAYTGATLLPAVVTGSSLSSGAAAAGTQAATGFGLAFIGVDLASGAMLDVRPNPLILVMIPETEPLPEDTYVETKEELEALLTELGRDLPTAEAEKELSSEPEANDNPESEVPAETETSS